ncbi:hypothetical protein Nepgr_029581 [Nepenthes gracilis]|uniref:Exocyst component Exo84 C-terminal domain-containing protein n=1 Tax=Nepenthes gracilis TaxID=150966 RepID=A0AAD3TCQ6_NEPGR|nr:hypothetical protein Nepgr_029581 [Nepenthes gracilis]
MESSDEDELLSYHEGITPQSMINSVYQSRAEKEIRKLCCDLLDLKDSVENICGNTRTKYLAFLRLSEEVVEMEHELVELRKHISAQGILIQDLISGVFHELDEWIRADALESPQDPQVYELEEQSPNEIDDPKRTFLEKIDILLAEYKIEEVIEALDAEEKSSPELRISGDTVSEISSYRSAFLERKAILEDQLVGITEQPLIGSIELKKAYSGLLRLGKGPLAHQLLLKRHGSHLQKSIEAFLPSCSLYPKTFPATLSKIVFSVISLVAKESASTFGDNLVYTNRIVQWAEQEIEYFVRLVKENGPPSETITALHAASICVEASLSYGSVLESQGLQLSKLLMVLLCPYMEEVLEMNFRRARRVALELVENDSELPLPPLFVSSLSVFAISSDRVLIDTGLRFIFVVQDIVEQLTPLAILHFGGNVLGRILQLFDKFVDLLMKGLPSPSEDDSLAELKEATALKAETDSQQLALLGVAYTVADELLPVIVSRIWSAQNESSETRSGLPESIVPTASNAMDYKEWKRQLQHSLDKLKDHFCRQYVLSFIYSREGKTQLDARMYVKGEGKDLLWDSHPLPSLPFQALFAKLQQLATVAGDVLLGKDKIQKVLLARLTETVVIWLSDEQEFWGVLEDESVPLKPFGLQQLILDMHFTVEIARFAGHSSRNVLQIVSAITARAIKTFAAKGVDPLSALHEDEWFAKAAKAAINELLMRPSGSEVSESDEEHLMLDHDIASDSDDTLSCPSTVESFHSFLGKKSLRTVIHWVGLSFTRDDNFSYSIEALPEKLLEHTPF